MTSMDCSMANWPVVSLERLQSRKLTWPSYPIVGKRRKRKNRRMLFDRRKEHSGHKRHLECHRHVKCQYNKGYDGIDDFAAVATDLRGFSDKDIDLSSAASLRMQAALASVFVMVPRCGVLCSSISVNTSGNNFEHIMKIIPLPRVPIRVLSLFDGIATGLHILKDKLNLQVDAYFSSEVDGSAIQVQRHHYHGQIHMVGCVKKIQSTLLHSLGRIDLLIGGSPCNELSRVNPRRKGLRDSTGSGYLFFEYLRIKNFLAHQAAARGHCFFWMFENVHNMDNLTRQHISQSLECTPVTLCSSQHLPIRRKRLFWGNIPGMSKVTNMVHQPTLADLLKPYRHPVVACIPTLTTTTHSQLTGSQRLLPIVDNGQECGLTVLEREVLLGYPEHYTDIGTLSSTVRSKLLGRAWCVPTVEGILRPLTEMFSRDD